MGRTWSAVAVVGRGWDRSSAGRGRRRAGGGGGATSAQSPGPLRAERPLHRVQRDRRRRRPAAGRSTPRTGGASRSWTPRARRSPDVDAKGRLRSFGLTELFFEASEPSFKEFPFREFKKRFPEGTYRFRGRRRRRPPASIGSDRLSHLIPAAPKVTFPTRGARVDPDRLQGDLGARDQARRRPDRQLPGDRQAGRPRAEHVPAARPRRARRSLPSSCGRAPRSSGEVLARERSGNQTITEFPAFRSA